MTLYGVQEIAQALGVPRATISQWLRRGKMPEPTGRLAAGPVWTERVIGPWIKEHQSQGA
jgi:predicted site-specific integrase-resolvase